LQELLARSLSLVPYFLIVSIMPDLVVKLTLACETQGQ